MLWEAFQYLATPAPAWARRHGFLRESIAIGARHDRLYRSWEPHLNASREVVAHAASLCPRGRRAVVLGSGHGYDLPLAELANRFDTVTLVDAVHPWRIRWRARCRQGVELHHADVTGRFAPPPPLDADLIVSLNLISQLGLAPGETETERARLRAAHLTWLLSAPATVCVIGDIARTEIKTPDQSRKTVWSPWPDENSLPAADFDREWDWALAPYGEISKETAVERRVRAAIWLSR